MSRRGRNSTGWIMGAGLMVLALSVDVQAAPQPVTASQAAINPQDLELFVDGLVQEAMTSEHIAGLSVAIVQHGKPVLLKGYGVARQTPLTKVDAYQTLFRLGSLSKTFTWIEVMRQVEAGHMRLDASIDTYLPPALRTADLRFDKPITVADLMDHSAGYENRDIGRLFSDDAGLRPLETYLADNRPRRVRPPGEFPTYSNYGASLAALAAARSAGLPFDSLVERDITGPLDMTSTTFREPYKPRAGLPRPMDLLLASRLSDGFVWHDGRFRKQPFEHILASPAGSASSTAADMSRYMLAQLAGGSLNGANIYGPATANALRTQLFPRPLGVNGWAHGYQVIALPGGRPSYGHGGATQLFFTSMLLAPDLDLGIFITDNSRTGEAFVRRFPQEVVQHFYPPPPVAAAAANSVWNQRARYDGAYLGTRRAYSGLQEALAHFTSAASVKVTSDGYLATKTSSTQIWRGQGPEGLFASMDNDDRILFQFDGAGRAIRWLNASGTLAYERVGWWQTPAAFFLGGLLVLAASVGTLAGFLAKPTAPGSASPWQARSRVLGLVVAALWIVALGALALWAPGAASGGDAGWPGAGLLTASWAALTASLGAALLAALAPLALTKGTSAEPRWSVAAKLRHLVSVTIYLAFAALLLSWGALAPWDF